MEGLVIIGVSGRVSEKRGGAEPAGNRLNQRWQYHNAGPEGDVDL